MVEIRFLDKYRCSYLFLLVGANPLPNYVAASLLASDNACVFLLHSKVTFEVAERLKRSLQEARPSLNIFSRQISETDGQQIEAQVQAILAELPLPSAKADVGINYTGGTKPMAVHSYRAIREVFPQATFSYLDAGSLQMYITRGDDPTQSVFVGRHVSLSIDELVGLHGYKLKSPVGRTPRSANLSRALARVHSSPSGFQRWREWLLLSQEARSLQHLSQDPTLSPIWAELQSISETDEPTESRIAESLGMENLGSLAKYFIGEWLEEYTLDAIQQFSEALQIKHYGIDLHLYRRNSREFQLDVAAMFGYQLFAISCTATEEADKKGQNTKPGRAKEHLMEAFVRARQLGGDEARYGIVCCVQHPMELQREMEQRWDVEGRVRVFGMSDLPYLPDRMKQWFMTANKE